MRSDPSTLISGISAAEPPPPTFEGASRSAFIATGMGIIILVLLSAHGMDHGLSHDEAQHVTAGMLSAREGLLPYRDYPYFHTPYLAFAYWGIFEWTEHLMLAARLLSICCAAATLTAICYVALRVLRSFSPLRRLLMTAGVATVALTAPVFAKSVGFAWNQEPATLFALLSFLSLMAGLRRASLLMVAAGGLCLGIAIGTRLTFAPLMAPSIGVILLSASQGTASRRFLLSLLFLAFVGVALIPVAAFLVIAPAALIFGTWEYSQVNIIYRNATGNPRTMTFLKKLRFMFKEVLRPGLVFAVSTIAAGFSALWGKKLRRLRCGAELASCMLFIPFLMIGALAPSPAFDQYFYPLVPFGALILIYSLASLPPTSRGYRLAPVAVCSAALVGIVAGGGNYKGIENLFSPEAWAPMEQHALGKKVRQHVQSGKVLTLSPMPVVEAGLGVYPSFALGPMGWRVAPFVDAEKREIVGLVSKEQLDAYLSKDPPAAVLTGTAKRWEGDFVHYAQKQGYRPVKISRKMTLWLNPGAVGSSL